MRKGRFWSIIVILCVMIGASYVVLFYRLKQRIVFGHSARHANLEDRILTKVFYPMEMLDRRLEFRRDIAGFQGDWALTVRGDEGVLHLSEDGSYRISIRIDGTHFNEQGKLIDAYGGSPGGMLDGTRSGNRIVDRTEGIPPT